jgi:NADP-dependent 3-hydroxy acid dehydrogenase YdfG
MADALAEPQWFNLAKKKSTNHMAIRVWLITDAARGIGAEIAKAALVDSNQVVASDHKPEAVGRYL